MQLDGWIDGYIYLYVDRRMDEKITGRFTHTYNKLYIGLQKNGYRYIECMVNGWNDRNTS